MTTYISDTAHYKEVLALLPQVKHSLWSLIFLCCVVAAKSSVATL